MFFKMYFSILIWSNSQIFAYYEMNSKNNYKKATYTPQDSFQCGTYFPTCLYHLFFFNRLRKLLKNRIKDGQTRLLWK